MKIKLQPQPGKQTEFLASEADIVIYGGSAGSGKTYGLLLEGLRGYDVSTYGGVIFRREATQLTRPGAIWDESFDIYSLVEGKPNNSKLTWKFPSGAHLAFCGLQLEADKYSWKGAQLDYIAFDELTEFSETQFWYMLTRLRSRSGKLIPYCRCTCNPEANWVLDLLQWWIAEDGFPISERSGVLRWYYRAEGHIHWFATRAEAVTTMLTNGIDKKITPKSLTFISATINDNQILLEKNPEYYASLAQAPPDERDKLLLGNWKIKPAGKLFNINDFKSFAVPPADFDCKIITVDTAMEIKAANDFTVYQVWVRSNHKIYLLKQVRGKFDFGQQLQILYALILEEKPDWVAIEKAATGSSLLQEIRKKVPIPLMALVRTKDKYSRGYECQGYVQGGYVYLDKRADYYPSIAMEWSNFSPENKTKVSIHDDTVDPGMDAINLLLIKKIGYNPAHEQPVLDILQKNAFGATGKKPKERFHFASSTRY